MSTFSKFVYILLIIGGLNMGIVGFFDTNLISDIFSEEVTRIIYSLIGVAALAGLYKVASNGTNTTAVKKK